MKKIMVVLAIVMGGFIAFNSCSDDVVEGGNDVKTTRAVRAIQRDFKFWFNSYPNTPSLMLHSRKYKMRMMIFVSYWRLDEIERDGAKHCFMNDASQIKKKWLPNPKAIINCERDSLSFRDEHNGSITYDIRSSQWVMTDMIGSSTGYLVKMDTLVKKRILTENNAGNFYPTLVACFYNPDNLSDRIVVAMKYNGYYDVFSTGYKYFFGADIYRGDLVNDYVRVLCDSLKM